VERHAGRQGVGFVRLELAFVLEAGSQDVFLHVLDLILGDGRAGVIRVGPDAVEGDGLHAGEDFRQEGQNGFDIDRHYVSPY